MAEYTTIWEMKKEDLAMKEKLSKLAILDTLLAKKEPLSEAEEVVKLSMGLDYSYTQPSDSEEYGGNTADSGYSETEDLIRQDQAEIDTQRAPVQYPPELECTAEIRQLVYGGGADTVDEYVRLGETTARKCLYQFTAGIIHLFGDEYLRRPTPENLQRLLHIGEQRGFPGMVGSIDCMHWEWKNCPTAWKGMYSRGTGKPTIVLEAVASSDLWIWHAFFGAPGTMNDLNILDRSPVFDEIINGNAQEVNFYVNGREYHLTYYLADGIYPKWTTFIQSIRLPQVRYLITQGLIPMPMSSLFP
uniref:Uncharacterized protein n=1 Tax=Brassica oleracea var. oleracea TaxID=109376 RepID=A0A0D3CUZ2_BRAOL